MRTKVKPRSLLLSGLIVLYLKILQLTGLRIFIHVGRRSNKRKGELRRLPEEDRFLPQCREELPLEGSRSCSGCPERQ